MFILTITMWVILVTIHWITEYLFCIKEKTLFWEYTILYSYCLIFFYTQGWIILLFESYFFNLWLKIICQTESWSGGSKLTHLKMVDTHNS